MTPTSGAAPYVLSAELFQAQLLDGANYSLELRPTDQVGSCFLDVSAGANNNIGTAALLDTGTYSVSGSVDSGSCRTLSLIIRDLTTNSIIDSQNVYIDNV